MWPAAFRSSRVAHHATSKPGLWSLYYHVSMLCIDGDRILTHGGEKMNRVYLVTGEREREGNHSFGLGVRLGLGWMERWDVDQKQGTVLLRFKVEECKLFTGKEDSWKHRWEFHWTMTIVVLLTETDLHLFSFIVYHSFEDEQSIPSQLWYKKRDWYRVWAEVWVHLVEDSVKCILHSTECETTMLP